VQAITKGEVAYLVARGGKPTIGHHEGQNEAVTLMALLGTDLPPHIVVNELTTVASAWTGAQCLAPFFSTSDLVVH
jgi:hypothetical protein